MKNRFHSLYVEKKERDDKVLGVQLNSCFVAKLSNKKKGFYLNGLNSNQIRNT